jgi:signal transduction histidine kinase/ActR/RegA family two-component response regulator
MPLFDRFRQRLSWRLTRDTVLVAMALGLVLNLIQITHDYFSARESMEEEVRALMRISHSPASQIAYNINIRLAEELLDGLLQHPATREAKILDAEGRTMSAASQSLPSSRYRWLSNQLFGESRVFSTELQVPQLEDLPLGRLQLTIDTYHYGIQFLERAAYTLLIGLVKSLALSAVLLAIFYFVLTRPMMGMINTLGRVKASSPEKIRLPVPENHRHDEIGTMVGIVNQHLEHMESNVAQLKAAKSAMKNYSSQLEREVKDRTREISEKNQALQQGNRALVKAKEDAMRRARSRADFLASMSHEIRTPLNGLLGMLDLALDSTHDRAQRNRLEIALNAGHSLLDLLNDILDVSKVEAGKLSLEKIPFSVRALIEETATLHAHQAHRKQIDLVNETGPDLPEMFLGDPTRTRQILNNLLGNAIKFTETGAIRVRARYTGTQLTLEVIDTGIGMSPDAQKHIFSAFSQAGPDTSRRYGGTGLGLALCRQLVERMEGQITVSSQPGSGSHFNVTLPLAVHQAAAPPLPQPMLDSLQRIGVAMDIDSKNPHRLAIESQLRAWSIPVGSTESKPESILMTADPQRAQDWEGKGVLLADRLGNLNNPGAATCLLSLPLRRGELFDCLCNVAKGSRLPSPNTAEDSPDRSNQTALDILLVEDNQVNQLVASTLLKKLGHQVAHAENGKRAVEAVRSQRYDLVLMDCQMPVMDGFEATRAIRNDADYATLPIIAVTGNALEGDKQACLDAGMNDYITKPYNREQLSEIITRWSPTPP